MEYINNIPYDIKYIIYKEYIPISKCMHCNSSILSYENIDNKNLYCDYCYFRNKFLKYKMILNEKKMNIISVTFVFIIFTMFRNLRIHIINLLYEFGNNFPFHLITFIYIIINLFFIYLYIIYHFIKSQ